MHPYLTADIPGTGGSIKDSPDDFMVEEIPAYPPCGEGEHLYLTFEKRGITTLEAIRRIAGALKIPERDIGYAGMKDAIGVTRQTISLQKVRPEVALALHLDSITPLAAIRHSNKLKLGHLKGNRFRIIVRGVTASAADTTAAILDVLLRRGVPNYFGTQRYGVQGNSHLIGAAMLRRDWQGGVECMIGDPRAVQDEQWRAAITAYRQGDPVEALRLMPRHCRTERDVLQRLIARPEAWERAFSVIHPRLKKLYLSACQSHLFDKVVELRLEQIDQVKAGDLAWKHLNGACFLVEDAGVEAPRAVAFEISASGPMFGCKMKQPAGAVLAMEQGILAGAACTAEAFDLGSGLRMEGERRPLRVQLGEPSFLVEDDLLQLEFTLPKGSYATSVVREIIKTF
ncbi:MAG: tRNA pseudouridine(13) synthase TruD [Desulfuromonadales bacterium]|nr:tRNA pseudouridine(13) synthase TruD [Desulfuromonadales bacterium]